MQEKIECKIGILRHRKSDSHDLLLTAVPEKFRLTFQQSVIDPLLVERLRQRHMQLNIDLIRAYADEMMVRMLYLCPPEAMRFQTAARGLHRLFILQKKIDIPGLSQLRHRIVFRRCTALQYHGRDSAVRQRSDDIPA